MIGKDFTAQDGAYAALDAEYQKWMRRQRLDLPGSVEQYLDDESLTQEQRAWLRWFVLRWEAA